MKIAYMSHGYIKVVSPQQMGKLIAKIDRTEVWCRTKVVMKYEQEGPLTTVKWVTGNPEWMVFSQTYRRITDEEQRFIEFGRRSGRMVGEILGLYAGAYSLSALLVREPDATQWTWDDTMGDGPTFRQIAKHARQRGLQAKIVKPSTLFQMWKKGLIV